MLPDTFDLTDVIDTREHDARLFGLMAMLALPELVTLDGKTRKREVEIEVGGHWVPVDAVSIDAYGVTFTHGVNGHRVEWRFLRIEGVPRWRVDAHVPRLPVGTHFEHDTRPIDRWTADDD